MKRIASVLAFAVALALAAPAGAIDLSASATDLTSIGLPGYWGLRVDCDHSEIAPLTLAVNPRYEPMVLPTDGIPRPGSSTITPPSDPTRDYVLVIWTDTHASPPVGDGQPAWPSTCVKSNALASYMLIGRVSGVPIDGY